MTEAPVSETLAGLDVFAGVSPAELAPLAGRARMETLPAGTPLFAEGDEGTALYVVLKGAVELTQASRRGEPVRLSLLDRGQVFGELAVFDGLPRSASATAFTDATLLVLPADAVMEALAAPGPLASAVLRNVARKLSLRLRDADAEIRALAERR